MSSGFATCRDRCRSFRSPLSLWDTPYLGSRMPTGAHWDPGIQGALLAGVRQRFWEPHLLTELFPSHSGVIGSGLCVFSRFPILDTLLYQYSLNGYPYMVSGEGSTWHRGVHPHRASVALTCPSSPWAAPAWGLVLRQVRRSRRYENLRDHLQRLRHPCEHLREEPSMGGTVGRRGVSGHTPLSLSPCFNHCCLPSVLDYAPI